MRGGNQVAGAQIMFVDLAPTSGPTLPAKLPSTTQPCGAPSRARSTFSRISSLDDSSQPGFQESVSSGMKGTPSSAASCLPVVLWWNRIIEAISRMGQSGFPCLLLHTVNCQRANESDGELTRIPNDMNSVLPVCVADEWWWGHPIQSESARACMALYGYIYRPMADPIADRQHLQLSASRERPCCAPLQLLLQLL